jgi:hypothetical protein
MTPDAAQLQHRARRLLPSEVYDYYAGGSGRERTLHSSEKAWRRPWMAPRAGALYVLSTRSTRTIEDVAEVLAAERGAWWFQVYIMRDRDLTARLVQRAAAAGAAALVLTADTPVTGRRRRAHRRERAGGPGSRGGGRVRWQACAVGTCLWWRGRRALVPGRAHRRPGPRHGPGGRRVRHRHRWYRRNGRAGSGAGMTLPGHGHTLEQ